MKSLSYILGLTLLLGSPSLAIASREQTTQQIPLATSVEGRIESDITWTDRSNLNQTRTKVVFREPIKFADGKVAIPKGSFLIVEVDQNSDRFVYLEAITLSYEDSQGQLIQKDLRRGTFLIKSDEGQPLAFRTKTKGGNNILRNLVGDVAQDAARQLPGRVGSSTSRTIRRNTRSSNRRNNNNTYSVRRNTKVSIQVNSFLEVR